MHLHRAVNDAEATSGLQFCVVVCADDGPVVDQADEALAALGVSDRPAVLVAARRTDGTVEVALGETAGERLSADDVREVLDLCPLTDDEDLRTRVAAIVLTLADRAGPGDADPATPEAPDVVEV